MIDTKNFHSINNDAVNSAKSPVRLADHGMIIWLGMRTVQGPLPLSVQAKLANTFGLCQI